MSGGIVKQATEIFKEKEQWYSFLELCRAKDDIKKAWYTSLKEKMNEAFAKNHVIEQWAYDSWGSWDYRWYLKEFGRESVCIWWTGNSLHLWANQNQHDIKKLSDLLQQKKYLPIVSCFERQDEINHPDNAYKIIERGNLKFDDIDDGHMGTDRLAWFACFETEKFVNQMVDKIDRFRKNDTVTKLLSDINKETLK